MGFSADWLALREPADLAARNGDLLARLAGTMQGSAPSAVLDLGCGTGSTLRALAPHLPEGTQWRLFDHDRSLLAQAMARHGAVARAHQGDLARVDLLPLADLGLVTASALLDLVSRDWLAALVDRLAARHLPFYGALSYDGQMSWSPEDAADAGIVAAFNRHQTGDKGLGPALGPAAATVAAALFRDAGYDVSTGPSPWQLGPQDRPLIRDLVTGIAAAASEAGAIGADDWAARRAKTSRCTIGHIDLLALPKSS